MMQVAVGSKENEIVAAPKVLQALDLDGAIVMGDAMHTQRQLNIEIVEAGGGYLWKVKGNQPRTKWANEKLFVHEMVNLKNGVPMTRDFQIAV